MNKNIFVTVGNWDIAALGTDANEEKEKHISWKTNHKA